MRSCLTGAAVVALLVVGVLVVGVLGVVLGERAVRRGRAERVSSR